MVRPTENSYDDPDFMAAQVTAGQHREVIGGLWDQIGLLQLDFLRAQGLLPNHHMLDLGCGSLRGGVHFVRYLDAGRYHGLDSNQSLLDVGYETELAVVGLQDRLPRSNLFCNPDFFLPVEDGFFDIGIAQSVFTHLTFNSIRRCLELVAPKQALVCTVRATRAVDATAASVQEEAGEEASAEGNKEEAK